VATDKIQIGSEARVLEIGRAGIVQEAPPALGRPPIRERLRTLLSTLRKFASFLVAISLWTRVLYIVLAVISGAVWALSLARFFFSTGWPALFHLAYAAASGGFAIVCSLAVFDPSSPERLRRHLDRRIRPNRG